MAAPAADAPVSASSPRNVHLGYERLPFPAVATAIQNRDYRAFMAALPKDPKLQASIAQGGAGYGIVQHAVHRGTPAILRELIRLGADFRKEDSRPSPDGTLVLKAVYGWMSWNDAVAEPPPGVGESPAFAETIQVLIDAGARVDVTDYERTALSIVANQPRDPQALTIATVLVNNGVPLDFGEPLIKAMGRDSLEMFELMLRSPGVPQRAKDLALKKAINDRKGAFAVALMNAGASPTVSPPARASAQDSSLLYEAVFPKLDRDLVKALIAKKVNPNVVGRDGSTPLLRVIGDFELVLLLLDARADPDVRRTSDGKTALHVAVTLPDVKIRNDVVDLLLRRKANPNITDASGYTALMYVPSADLGVLDAILNAGGKVVVSGTDAAYYRQYNAPVGPVTWSILHGKDTLGALLLLRDKRVADDDCGAIYYAAGTGAIATLRGLFNAKVNPSAATGTDGMTPFLFAAYRGQVEAMNVLLERKAGNVNEAIPVRGETALMLAASQDHIATMKFLIDRGANVNARASSGRTALGYAIAGGSEEATRLLLRHGAVD